MRAALLAALSAGAGLLASLSKPSAAAETTPEGNAMPRTGTRGERNNNPGNIRYSPLWKWQGQTGKDDAGYLTFDRVENGIRAIAKDLQSKSRRGLESVNAIINAYAPSSENDTGSYIRAVCAELQCKPDDALDLQDVDTLTMFVTAIIRHENGRVIYAGQTIQTGVRDAL